MDGLVEEKLWNYPLKRWRKLFKLNNSQELNLETKQHSLSTVWPDVAIKNSPILSKSCPKIQQWIFLLMYIRFFKKPKKSPNFGYFFKNIRFLELSKIAQFGNTALVLKIIDDREALSCQILFSITKIFFKQIGPFPTSFSLFSYL